MKQTLIAVLASLMLAGAISAAAGVSANTSTGSSVLIGDGSAPFPVNAPTVDSGTSSLTR